MYFEITYQHDYPGASLEENTILVKTDSMSCAIKAFYDYFGEKEYPFVNSVKHVKYEHIILK